MSFYPFKFFSKNHHGRDFVVGDIHGMFSMLESHLDSLNFDSEVDRVFSVGDLIDRGPESYRVLEFLDKPWFHSIKGNHEMMLIEAKHRKTNYRSWIKNNGGAWWGDIDPETQTEIRARLSDLAVVFEVATNSGKIGIVHADVPTAQSWQEVIHSIYSDEEARDYMMWSRNRFKNLQRTGETSEIKGIDLVVMGHMPTNKPINSSNSYYIDTGAVYCNDKDLGSLTLLQIQPKIKAFQYPKPLF